MASHCWPAACLLLPAFPPSGHTKPPARNLAPNLLTVARVLWPVAIAATLYAVFNLSPAWPICAATPILLLLHRVPRPKWKAVFLAGFELENVLIILGAMLFKTILQAGEAAPQIVAFFTDVHVPPILLIFLVPFIVAVTTGLTFASFAITLPVLLPFLQGPHGIHMGREVLFVASVISGLLLTPIHLCLALSVTYFQASWFAIVARFLPGVLAMLATGLLLTLLC